MTSLLTKSHILLYPVIFVTSYPQHWSRLISCLVHRCLWPLPESHSGVVNTKLYLPSFIWGLNHFKLEVTQPRVHWMETCSREMWFKSLWIWSACFEGTRPPPPPLSLSSSSCLSHLHVIIYILCCETHSTIKDDGHNFHFFYIRKEVLKLKKKKTSQPAVEWEAVS